MNHRIHLLLLGCGLLFACGDDTSTGGGGAGAHGGNGQGGTGAHEGGTPTTGGGGEGTGAGSVGGQGGQAQGGQGGQGGQAQGGQGGDGGGGGGGNIPPKPQYGDQIDRMGRPAINTALDGAFVQLDGGNNRVVADSATRATLEDGYNEDLDPSGWSTTYSPLFAANLAMLDALDTGLNGTTNQTACQNQVGQCHDINTMGCYNVFANAATNDQLWVKSDGSNCSASAPASPLEGYFAVEAAALGTANNGCGGRRPIDDVILVTYSVLAVGSVVGFDDGITAPAGLHPTTFPYLADPH